MVRVLKGVFVLALLAPARLAAQSASDELFETGVQAAAGAAAAVDLFLEDAAADDDEDERDAPSGWVRSHLATMTLREKIGQMMMIDAKGTHLTAEFAKIMADGAFGNVIFFERNLTNEDQAGAFLKDLQANALVRTGVPLLTALDQEGGKVDRLGPMTNLGLTRHGARTLGKVYDFDPKRARKLVTTASTKIAATMKRLGFNMNLAPVLDLTNDRHSFIYDRSFGNDPKAVTKITRDFIRAMEKGGVASTGKHFPNLSLTRTDSHQALPVLNRTLAQLRKHEFLPFAGLRDDMGAVMVGHVLVPALDKELPASISPRIVRVLRETLGYQGVIMTDDVKMKALSIKYTPAEIAVRAVQAGCDMLIAVWDPAKQLAMVRALEDAVRTKKISTERIDQSVRRILELKERYAR